MSLLTFGQFLQTKRLAKGYNLGEATKACNLPHASFSRYEKGVAFPRGNAMKNLAKGLGITVEELQQWVPVEEPKLKMTERKTPIKNLIKAMQELSDKIEECMQGESLFERNIRSRSLDRLDRASELLGEILIVDEAF